MEKSQGFPMLASFPLRRPPHPRKLGECAVSGGARHGTLTKKGVGWGLAERIGKPWEKSQSMSEPIWETVFTGWERSDMIEER